MSTVHRDATITTPRLRLRRPVMSDAPRVAALANDLDLARMTTGVPHPCRLLDAEMFLARALAGDGQREQLFVIEDHEGAAGVIALNPNSAGVTEVGYWLGRPFWNRGYMSEALPAALAWGASAWGRRRIASGHFADNVASAAVLISAGFLYTGEVVPRRSLARAEPTPTRMMIWLA